MGPGLSAFTTFADIEMIDPGEWALKPGSVFWVTLGRMPWELGFKGSGRWVIVEAGFDTDLASIPWWGRWLINPADPAIIRAAVLHDALLRCGWHQQSAAGEFHAALRAGDVPRWKCSIMYFAVVAAIDRW